MTLKDYIQKNGLKSLLSILFEDCYIVWIYIFVNSVFITTVLGCIAYYAIEDSRLKKTININFFVLGLIVILIAHIMFLGAIKIKNYFIIEEASIRYSTMFISAFLILGYYAIQKSIMFSLSVSK